MDIIDIFGTGSVLVAASVCAYQAIRYKRAADRLNRTSAYAKFDPDTQRNLQREIFEGYRPASRDYIMCGGCGANVEVGEDGFTPKYHTCFSGMTTSDKEGDYQPALDFEIDPDKKIPIGYTGHLYKADDKNLSDCEEKSLIDWRRPV